jgi:8-oxo-dGTP pyrophosphatase MutT (NUDIX family)
MKILIKVNRAIPWMPSPSEGRLYITDEMPPIDVCGSAFGFVFDAAGRGPARVLLTRLKDRDWDIPGGRIEPGETPEQAAIREVMEEAFARVRVVELIGIQELEILGPRPANHRWNYPLSAQVFFLCRLEALLPFGANAESSERGFFAPEAARRVPTMVNHLEIYEEALRHIQT